MPNANNNYRNIANIINTQIMKNALGESVTVAEDLSNIVAIGKAISEMTSDTLKDYKKELCVGVHNFVINRLVEEKRFDILRNAQQFGGALQRLMASDLLTAQDSHLLNLTNGTSYLDGKFYGLPLSAKIYPDTKAFKVVHSISDDDFAQKFTNRDDVVEYISLLVTTEKNTIEIEVAQLEKRILNMGIVEAVKGGREVHLITEFNNAIGETFTSYEQIKADREILTYFSDFVKGIISELGSYMLEPNKKYNDGSVVTFTPREDVKCVLITKFDNDLEYLGTPTDYHRVDMPLSYKTVNAWQNGGTSMLIPFDKATLIKTTEASEGADHTRYENIVGVVYDSMSMGATVKADKVTVEPVGAEGFTNYHHHMAMDYYVDTRLGCVALVLD